MTNRPGSRSARPAASGPATTRRSTTSPASARTGRKRVAAESRASARALAVVAAVRGARGPRNRDDRRTRTDLARSGRMVVLAFVAVAFLAVLLLGYFPTVTLIDQRKSTSAAEAQAQSLAATNAQLAQRVKTLQTPGEVERLARAQYGLVRPGEQAYAILPSRAQQQAKASAWPFAGADELFTDR